MREAGEIIPVSAKHSRALHNDEATYRAKHAIDLDLDTNSYTKAGSDGTCWLKLILDKVYCVQHLKLYWPSGDPVFTLTCTYSDCNKCEGSYCDLYTLTVSTEEDVSDLSPESDCKYGDTVKLDRVSIISGGFGVNELAILGKSGKLPFIKIYILHI